MRTDQFDDEAKAIWRAYAEGRMTDEAAQAAVEAVEARRAIPGGDAPANPSRPPAGRQRPSGKREKMFGLGRPRALDRNAKARVMHLARCLTHRTEKGRAYGSITAKALAVLEALLWAFHNAKSGLCFPSYEKIAEVAHCARSTVYEAIAALEAAGIMSWVNRLKRVREWMPGLPGVGATRVRVLRTSNAYAFNDPNSSKSDFPSGTGNQAFPSLLSTGAAATKRLGRGSVGAISSPPDEVGARHMEQRAT